MRKVIIILISTISGVALIVLIILLACSSYRIPPNYVGLFVDKWTLEMSDSAQKPGFYMKPPMNRLVLFPTSLIVHSFHGSEYNVNTRTSDGLELALNGEVYIKMDPDYVKDIYLTYGEDYNEFIRMKIKSEIRNIGATFSANHYQTQFSTITHTMEERLMRDLPNYHFSLDRICITSYDLPDAYEDILLQIAVATQDLRIAETEKVTEETALTVMQEKAERDIEIDVKYQQGLLDNTLTEETSKLSAKQYNYAIEAMSLSMVLKDKDPTNPGKGDNDYDVILGNPSYYNKLLLYTELYKGKTPVLSASKVYYRG